MNSGKVRMSLYTAGGLVGLCASAYAVSQVPPFDYSGIKGGKDTYDLIEKHDSAAQKFERNFEALSEELEGDKRMIVDKANLYCAKEQVRNRWYGDDEENHPGAYHRYWYDMHQLCKRYSGTFYEQISSQIKENQERGKEIAAYRKDVESLKEWAQYTDPVPTVFGSMSLAFMSVISLFAAAGLFDKKIPEANKTP